MMEGKHSWLVLEKKEAATNLISALKHQLSTDTASGSPAVAGTYNALGIEWNGTYFDINDLSVLTKQKQEAVIATLNFIGHAQILF